MESESPGVNDIASRLRLRHTVAKKTRHGDRSVAISFADPGLLAERPALLVDDIVSSGTTLMAAAKALIAMGATAVDAVVTHALFPPAMTVAFASAGIRLDPLDRQRAASDQCDFTRRDSRGRLAVRTERRNLPGDDNMSVTVRFCGAARTVTGSCYLVETPRGASWSIAACSRGRRP